MQVTIGTFPIAEVSNGHTFFVQKLHDIVGVPPVCVHTTYQYGDATTYAYGKRERLRDAHLLLLERVHPSGSPLIPPPHFRGVVFGVSTLRSCPSGALWARSTP